MLYELPQLHVRCLGLMRRPINFSGLTCLRLPKLLCYGFIYGILAILVLIFEPSAGGLFLFLYFLWLGAFSLLLKTRNIYNAVQKTLMLHVATPVKPFVLYLRDRFGESKTTRAPIHGEIVTIPSRVSARCLQNSLANIIPVYGLWEPFSDTGDHLQFRPILSTDARWQDDITALSATAALVVMDCEKASPGIAWELDFLLKRPSLLKKTLVIKGENDPHLDIIADKARWIVGIKDRSNGASLTGKFKLPTDLILTLHSLTKGKL
jgi:hypothetical protein